MWYTTRHEGYDTEGRKARAPARMFSGDTLERLLGSALRLGLLVKLISMLAMVIGYYAFGGSKIFTYDLEYTTEAMRADSKYVLYLAVWSALSLMGALYLGTFQAFLSDDAAWARGYRAGSKAFAVGAFFDICSNLFQLVAYVWMSSHYSELWWENYKTGGVDWLFFGVCRAIAGIAYLCYAPALLLLELYHDEGTNEWHGVLNAFLFKVAGICEFCCIFLKYDCGLSVFVAIVAHLSALFWAFNFEDELMETSTALNETELCNEVEQEVGKFTKLSPYNLH